MVGATELLQFGINVDLVVIDGEGALSGLDIGIDFCDAFQLQVASHGSGTTTSRHARQLQLDQLNTGTIDRLIQIGRLFDLRFCLCCFGRLGVTTATQEQTCQAKAESNRIRRTTHLVHPLKELTNLRLTPTAS